MAQIKFNLSVIKSAIQFVCTVANVLLEVIATVERTLTNG